MFLSRKWIVLLISITGISFMILLLIQFGWIKKSLEINRQHLDTKMREVSGKIRSSFLADKKFQNTFLSRGPEIKDFYIKNNAATGIGKIVKQKVDSVLDREHALSTLSINGRTGTYCYLMNEVPADQHNNEIDHSQYKICLCNNQYSGSLDIGINLAVNSHIWRTDSSGLILPSVILILLLIGLFVYAFYVINRQKKLAELKNDFINNLTHEFNTPLFSIGITSNLLLKSDAILQSDKLKNYVNLIRTEKNRIQTQVDKILQLTAIESGMAIIEKEKTDLHTLIKDAVSSFEPIISESQGRIILKTNAVHHIVIGDKVHLLNAFSNLLDNAYKYADKAPEIHITTTNTNNDFVICFADNGIGMRKNEMNMIFNKFYRVKDGDRHDVKGFGLGLSYVKRIVELHYGSIEVKSNPGEGSVFTIHLPYSINE